MHQDLLPVKGQLKAVPDASYQKTEKLEQDRGGFCYC